MSSDLIEEFDERLARISEVAGYPDIKTGMKQEMCQAAISILKEITLQIPVFTNHIINEKDLSKPEASKTSNKGHDTTPKPSKQSKRSASPLDEGSTNKKQRSSSPCNNAESPLSQYYNKKKDSNIVR